jgi:hypothetical protein
LKIAQQLWTIGKISRLDLAIERLQRAFCVQSKLRGPLRGSSQTLASANGTAEQSAKQPLGRIAAKGRFPPACDNCHGAATDLLGLEAVDRCGADESLPMTRAVVILKRPERPDREHCWHRGFFCFREEGGRDEKLLHKLALVSCS